MKPLQKTLSLLLCLSMLFQVAGLTCKAEGFVVYKEGKIEQEKVEQVLIPEEYISQQYIRQHMVYEDEMYEVKIAENILAQAYIIEMTVDVDTQTSMVGLLPPQFGEYEIDWPSVIAKFAVGTTIIIAVGVVQYLTEGSTYFIMASPGKVLTDALVGGAIEATLQVMTNEISQGGISSKAATKYSIEGFADGYMWGAIASVLHVASQNIKRLKAFRLATGGTLKIKLDGTVLDQAGNIIGKAVYGKEQWYLIDSASKVARVFDAKGKEILDVAEMQLPSNTTLSIGAQDALKVCYTDSSGTIYRVENNLVANNVYKINNAVYRTDDLGRIVEVSFDSLTLKNPGRGRLPIVDTKELIGHGDALFGDERGHLIADMFDGNNTLANIVPMSSNINNGSVKEIELIWKQAIQKGKTVKGSISLVYDNISFRPSEFTYSYDIGEGMIQSLIPNF